jgi:hypothetical protein
MAKLPNAFNAEDHGDMGFNPIPKDNYALKITESSYDQTKSKDGHALKLKIEVHEGEFEGRVIFRNLNLDNPSKQAMDIANREFATICRACGFPNGVEDSEELHGIVFTGEVDIKPGKGDYPAQNVIMNYLPLAGESKPAKPSEEKGSSASAPKAGKRPVFEDGDDD